MKRPVEDVRKSLNIMTRMGELTPEQMLKVMQVVESDVSGWLDEKIENLRSLITDWESAMGDTDESFYSLGIRRAIDVVSEQSAMDRLPILEQEDTPTEFPEEN